MQADPQVLGLCVHQKTSRPLWLHSVPSNQVDEVFLAEASGTGPVEGSGWTVNGAYNDSRLQTKSCG